MPSCTAALLALTLACAPPKSEGMTHTLKQVETNDRANNMATYSIPFLPVSAS
jgi:hypothetical protein